MMASQEEIEKISRKKHILPCPTAKIVILKLK